MKKAKLVLPLVTMLVFSALLSACSGPSNKAFSPQAVMSSQDMMRGYAQWLRENQSRQGMVMSPPGAKQQVRLPVRIAEI